MTLPPNQPDLFDVAWVGRESIRAKIAFEEAAEQAAAGRCRLALSTFIEGVHARGRLEMAQNRGRIERVHAPRPPEYDRALGTLLDRCLVRR